MGLLDLFGKKQQAANQSFLAKQRSQQAISKIKKLDLPLKIKQQMIDAEIYDIWFNSKDLQSLVQLLNHDEVIEYATVGIDEKNKTVMVVCTNQNLLIFGKKQAKRDAYVAPLGKISSAILKHQLAYDELALVVGDETLNINSINKIPAQILAKTIRKYAKFLQNNNENLDQQIAQVKKLKELVDQGILTEEEFEAKKKQILKI